MTSEEKEIFCKGFVKFYDGHKNHFGFIWAEQSSGSLKEEEIFFAESSLRNQSNSPKDKERIYCFAQKGKKGYAAKEVIKIGELTSDEKKKYSKLLFDNDFIQLVTDINTDKVSIKDSEANLLLEISMGLSSSLNHSIWKFIINNGNENQKEQLEEKFQSLSTHEQLNICSLYPEFLEGTVKKYFTLSTEDRNELVHKLFKHRKTELISDNLWSAFLKESYSTEDHELVLNAIKNNFKVNLTLENIHATKKSILEILEILEMNSDLNFNTSILLKFISDNIELFALEENSKSQIAIQAEKDFQLLITKFFRLQDVQKDIQKEFLNIFTLLVERVNIKNGLQLINVTNAISSSSILKFEGNFPHLKTTNNNEVKQLDDFLKTFEEKSRSIIEKKIKTENKEEVIQNINGLTNLGLLDSIERSLSRPQLLEIYLTEEGFDIDFNNDYKYLDKLPYNLQRTFIGRLVNENTTENSDNFWNIIDYLDQKIKALESYDFDPSTIFVLYLILQLKGNKSLSGNLINTNKLFEFVFSKLTNKTLIEEKLGGYFESCDGRAFVRDSGIVKRTKYSPCNFCEGKKMLDNQSKKPIINEFTEAPTYWCRNSTCVEPSRHSENNARIYPTFSTILEQLGFQDKDNFVGFVNGWVNKINTYLDHLECRECRHAIKPTDTSTGYYRVSNFYCENIDCTVHKNEEVIYLTHCINPKCQEVIDSRDSAQCPNGWYICSHCIGCCTTEKIQNRIEYHRKISKPYNGPTEGHKDLKEIYCPNCGNKITLSGDDQLYNQMLQKFKKMGTRHKNIVKTGTRGTDNKKWFLIKKLQSTTNEAFNKKIEKLRQAGFNIADDYIQGNDIALVSERFSNQSSSKSCQNCDFSINVNELYKEGDFYRAKAIEKFHEINFN